jgi:hypothetical protein
MPCSPAIPCIPPFSIGLGIGLPGAPSASAGLSLGAASSCGSVSFPVPAPGPPGFAFSLPVPSLDFPIGFPEDLLCILDLIQLLVPSGPLMPQLSLNFGKDIFDAIMKLLDQFMPFLMLYKFFLPILELIICIIEVLCALVNPFAVIGALDRLFTQCIPAFLNLFPIFALIIMIISLLLLLLALIEYIIEQIICFILALIKNILALVNAFQIGSAVGVLAIANKLASLLCIFQNLFVLLALFGIIIQVIKDILSLVFAIPPCEGGNNSNCCGPLTCPAIVQNTNSGSTGNMQYVNQVSAPITGFTIPGFPQPTVDVRTESWQVWDNNQVAPFRYWDIVQAQDVIDDGYNPPPVYFPTSSTFTASTPTNQAAYTVNMRLFYNPVQWGRTGTPQYLRFNNCIVLNAPTQDLVNGMNADVSVPNGVLYVAGGQGFLDDGTTIIDGYAADGITPMHGTQASLNNFFHLPQTVSASPSLNDGYTFTDVSYTWNASTPVLMQANLVTAGCMPQISFNRSFINNTMFANIASQTQNLKNLVNSPPDTQGFPDPAGAQQCMQAAVANLRSNMTLAGVSEFQAMANLCMTNLQTATNNALGSVIGIGFSPCNSTFTLTPSSQFTTLPIQVQVILNENNGLGLARNLPPSVAANIAAQIVGYPTFGTLGQFTYDGYQYFNADLTATETGAGCIMIAYQNQILCTNNLPTDGTNPTHTLQSLCYDFVYVPTAGVNIPSTGEGDTIGVQPRRGPQSNSGGSG